ncbi:subclass B3 metallo-beta-lactamase [Hymenobacter sp. HSC-4F20]|uniref:subclass B3 metallo-beta-lactamase n=1 Tax=Hymenobacter sp. HSC-4F20 TaxID=2864135 RepID=UPI001C734549|nr:subclass B3 metallo-beta-lactamase [Hymenobacter sp. HSC-4F20]MBX0292383.1 subclass B3 metallo-beta-lactamase [Hymenobacter sp. HSC-4F20]
MTSLKIKSGRSQQRQVLAGIAVLLTVAAMLIIPKWKAAINNGGQLPREPFCIAGNLYYVGTRDVTSFLLTGPAGHVLIDGGYPGTAPMILKNIATLGFRITDVKILLNSHAHFDHAGGLAALQQASGAQLWASEGDADILLSGGASDRNMAPVNWLVYLGLMKYPAPRVDHRFRDGAQIRLGSIRLTAHVTAGHTPGCTTWEFPVRDGNRELLAVSIGSLSLPMPTSLFDWTYDAALRQELERSFVTLRSLPADIYLSSHARSFSLKRKGEERTTAPDPVVPFIDRGGYLADITKAEAAFRRALKEQQM